MVEGAGQAHLLQHYESLSSLDKATFLNALSQIDFAYLARGGAILERNYVLSPIDIFTTESIKKEEKELCQIGLSYIGKGKVAPLFLCGGDGTRLGFGHAKGMYDMGLTRELTIFELQFTRLRKVAEQAGKWFPVFIMTSQKNYGEIHDFLATKDYFGFPAECIFLYKQRMVPSTDFEGRILLGSPTSLAMSPDGNGGWFASLADAGLVETAKKLGVEWLNVVSIDNVLGKTEDPIFIGATIRSGAECGAKVIRKAAPDERIGLICKNQGRPSVVEYYELDKLLMEGRAHLEGMEFGVILSYLFRLDAMERILDAPLPVHKVAKKIPYYANGETVKPDRENGYKYEMLATDLVERMASCLPFEVERAAEFAPVKNRHGVDSVDSAREMLTAAGYIL